MQEFINKVRKNKAELVTLLTNLKAEGKTVAGYGAPAKATTLLCYFGIGAELIDYIVDDSPLKEGRYMPGNHIPIVGSHELYEKKPDYVLILAWNFAEPIMKKLHENGYRGKCILPL